MKQRAFAIIGDKTSTSVDVVAANSSPCSSLTMKPKFAKLKGEIGASKLNYDLDE